MALILSRPLGIIEGVVANDGSTYIKIRLLKGVEEVSASDGEKKKVTINFGEGSFRFIPKDKFEERVEFVPPDETN